MIEVVLAVLFCAATLMLTSTFQIFGIAIGIALWIMAIDKVGDKISNDTFGKRIINGTIALTLVIGMPICFLVYLFIDKPVGVCLIVVNSAFLLLGLLFGWFTIKLPVS